MMRSKATQDVWRFTKRFLPYLSRVKATALLVCLLVLISPAISVAALWLMKVLIDDVLVAGQIDMLPTILGFYVLLVSTQIALSYAITRIDSAVIAQITQDVSVDFYQHVISASPNSFYKQSVGDLLAHLYGDVEYVEFLIFSGPLNLASSIIRVIFYTVFLMVLSLKLTLCALIVIPPLALLSRYFAPMIRRASRIARRKETSQTSLAEERLGVAPLVHAFGTHLIQTRAFKEKSDAARHARLKTVAIQAWFSLLVEAIASVGGLLVLGIGAYELHQGNVTVGTLIAFLGSLGSLYSPVRSLAKASGRFHRAAASVQRVTELLDTTSLVKERPGARPLLRVAGNLEFRDVKFQYPNGPPVLHGVDLRVAAGETLAIVGPNGGGKSTLIKLAMRLYDPSAGSVLLDDHDVRDISLGSLRKAMAIVFQEPYIVRGTIRENIESGGIPSLESFAAAANAAHLDSFVSPLSAGYSAPTGPRGSWLSEGQRQRIALARAIYRDAAVLLLDEATSSVDSEADELIQRALDRLSGKITILLVGHRLSTVQRADRVAVLEDGKIVEIGSPARLLAPGSRYRKLFDAQVRAATVDS